ncbi:toxin glutamine deamidase domain-containing protein [Streptomyces sp. NPDC102384]|uniref:toxin glutamine deamidase domain-containing protein n=1 Tax=Streptomyces sp. NPDC102384 TaxID=3366166 RepID=UPI0037F397B9
MNPGPSQTPNQPANPAPIQTPNQPTNQPPNQAPTQVPVQVPVQIPIQTPNNTPGAQQPSSNGHPAQESSDTTPPKPDQPAPLSQGRSLQQIRDSLNHAPYGLLTPDPAHQQALQDAVPRNEDGTPQRHPDPNGEWAQLQNDGGLQQPGRSNNCLDNARAGLSTWFGNPQVSAPRTPDKNHDGTLDTMSPERDSYNNLDAWAGRPQIWAGADHPGPYARIAHHLQEAGPGSAAVVGVQWPGGGGHAFNVYNHNGQITWVDHQTGEVSPNPIHTGAAGVRYVPFDSNGQTMDAPWEKKADTESEASDASESSDSDSSNSSESTNASDSDSSQSADSSQSSESPQPDQEQGGYGSDSTASYGAAPEQPNQDQQQGQQEQGQQQEEGQTRRDLDPTRANRNGGLVAENSGDLQQGVAPDPIQASLRESHSVYRTDLDAVHQTMRDWVDPEKHPEAPLSGLLEQAAERRKAYEKAMEPIETPRRALQAALIEERAIEKQVKEHEKNGETDQATALKDGKLAEAAERRAEAQQVHDEAVENHRGTKVPPTAFTDAELRDALGEKFATMNDGEKYAVIAAIARMSNSFHADNAVGNSPERPPDSHSPYEGTTKGSGNNQVPNPAQSDHESSAARRRNEAAADLPPKYRSDTESKKAFANLRSVFNESVAEDLSSVKRRKIQDLLEAALESGTGPDLSGKNYAVVELVDAKGNSTYVVDSSVPAGLDAVSPLHSESHILNWIDTVNGATEPGVDPKYTIAGLYTEREPCGSRELNSGYAECSRTIAQHESMNGVPVYYSTTYRHSDKESKNRMDEELADHLAVVAETWIHVRTQMVGSNGQGDPAA